MEDAPRLLLTAPPGTLAIPPATGKQVVRMRSVTDGDTIDVDFLLTVRLRLAHVNCPEHGTPDGERATLLVTRLLPEGVLLVVDLAGREKFGRTLASVTLPDGRDLGQVLLDAGLAKPYEGHGPRGSPGQD